MAAGVMAPWHDYALHCRGEHGERTRHGHVLESLPGARVFLGYVT